jgi:hypothetical protein
VVSVPIYVMAVGVNPVTETIKSWSSEIMVRIDISPSEVIAVAVMMMIVVVAVPRGMTTVVVMTIPRFGGIWCEQCGTGDDCHGK